jgi:hypothetical protein
LFLNLHFSQFILRLGRFGVSEVVIFEHIRFFFRTGKESDIPAFGSAILAVIKSSPALSNFILLSIDEVCAFLLIGKSDSVRAVYLSIIVECLQRARPETKLAFGNALINKMDDIHLICSHRDNLDSFLRPLLRCTPDSSWGKRLHKFIAITLPEYVSSHALDVIYSTINLSVIFELFSNDTKPPRDFDDPVLFDNLFRSPLHAEPLSVFLQALVRAKIIPFRRDTDLETLTRIFVMLATSDNADAATLVSRFETKCIPIATEKQTADFWLALAGAYERSKRVFSLRFFLNCLGSLPKYLFYRAQSVSEAVVALITELIRDCPDSAAGSVFSGLCDLLPVLTSRVSSIDLENSRAAIARHADSFFAVVRAAAARFPDAVGACLALSGAKFIALLCAFGDAIMDQLFASALALLVDNGVSPAAFFAHASFADFLGAIDALLRGRRQPPPAAHVLALVPPDGTDRFLRSEFFALSVAAAFAPPGDSSAPALSAFLLERASPANLRAITAILWRDSVVRRIPPVPECHSLSSALLTKFPISIEPFHSTGHFVFFYGQLTGETLSMAQRPFFAQTLAAFNEAFLQYSASARGFFKPKLRSLTDAYGEVAFVPFFALMFAASPEPQFENAVPRLIASFALLLPKYAAAALAALRERPAIRVVPLSVKPFASEMVAKVCRTAGAGRADARQVLVRELDAALQVAPPDFAVLNPVCGALLEIGVGDAKIGIAGRMTELYLQAGDLAIFRDGVLDLLEAVGTADLALSWIERFWNLLLPVLSAPREPGNVEALQGLFEAAQNAVALIQRFEKRFEIALKSLDGHRDLLTACALELTSVKIPGSEEFVQTLVDWSIEIIP